MSEISAALVKTLREATGVGIMECKAALSANNGDVELAKEWLRKKGLSSAGKKSDRVTSEGVIALSESNNSLALVELNSETDFVAKNEKFVQLAETIADEAVKNNYSIEEFQSAKLSNGTPLSDAISENIATLGENIKLSKIARISCKENGIVQFYVHNALSSKCGKIGVGIAIESDNKIEDQEAVKNLAKQICMHIAATKPESLDVNSLDPQKVQKEKDILSEQARASGKPENVIEKMIEGRMRKFYEEVVLLEQPFVMNPDKKVSAIVDELGKSLGCNLSISSFIRLVVGAA